MSLTYPEQNVYKDHKIFDARTAPVETHCGFSSLTNFLAESGLDLTGFVTTFLDASCSHSVGCSKIVFNCNLQGDFRFSLFGQFKDLWQISIYLFFKNFYLSPQLAQFSAATVANYLKFYLYIEPQQASVRVDFQCCQMPISNPRIYRIA